MMKFCVYFKDVTARHHSYSSFSTWSHQWIEKKSISWSDFFCGEDPLLRNSYLNWLWFLSEYYSNALHKLYNEDICLMKVQLHAIARNCTWFPRCFQGIIWDSHETSGAVAVFQLPHQTSGIVAALSGENDHLSILESCVEKMQRISFRNVITIINILSIIRLMRGMINI